MGLSRRSARAPQSESGALRMQQSELSPVEAQCGEKSSRSIGGRLRDNGRRCINLFKPGRLSMPPQAYPKDCPAPSHRQSLAPIDPPSRSATSRRFTMADLPAMITMLEESNQPRAMGAVTSDKSHTEAPDVHVTNMMRHSAFVGRASQKDSINTNAELHSRTNSLFSLDLAGSIKKPRLWLDRMKGYTIRGLDRFSLPVSGTVDSSGGVDDLIGVGSQYDSVNRANRLVLHGVQENIEEVETHGTAFLRTPGSEHDLATVPRSLWNTTFTRNPSSTIISRRSHAVRPEIPPEIDDLTRRLSNDTAPISASVVESVFARPSSIISTATSWESNGRVSAESRGRSLFRKNASSSSIFSSRASPGPHPEIDMDDHPTPPMPLPVTAWPHRSIDSWVAGLDHSASNHLTAAGRVAQQRRANKSRLNELSQEDVLDELDEPTASTPVQTEDHDGDDLGNTVEPALSTIEEGCSDAGCSTNEPISMQYQTLGDMPQTAFLSIPRSKSTRETISCSVTDTAAESTSAKSRQRDQTPVTSVAEDLDPGDTEVDEMSEDDESISNLIDETNESFYEALIATSLDSALVTAMASRDGAGKKRGFDDRNPGGSSRGNEDDQDKRRKTDASLAKERRPKIVSNLACPFPKAHPGRKWPRCQRPFASVHRMKEHIYRTHKMPIRCPRCFEKFAEAKELEKHAREATRCPILAPPDEMPGIDEGTDKKLRSRAGARNCTQEEKWKHMFKIIFPQVQDEAIPSPYYDLQVLENPMSLETRAQYHRFLRKEIPHRVTRRVTQWLSEMLGVRDNLHLSERRISEEIHQAVWDAIDDVLPSLLPHTAPSYHSGSQPSSTTDALKLSTSTFLLRSTHLPNTSATVGESQASPGVEDVTTAQEPGYHNHITISDVQPARTQSLVPTFDFDEDLLSAHPKSQATMEASTILNEDFLPITSQSSLHSPSQPLQPDFSNYAVFDFNFLDLNTTKSIQKMPTCRAINLISLQLGSGVQI